MSLLNITNNVLDTSKNSLTGLKNEKTLKGTRQDKKNERLNDKKPKFDISHAHLPRVLTLRDRKTGHSNILTLEKKPLTPTTRGTEQSNVKTINKLNIPIGIPEKNTELSKTVPTKKKSNILSKKKIVVHPSLVSIKNVDQPNVEIPKKDTEQPNTMGTKRKLNILSKKKKTTLPNITPTEKDTERPNIVRTKKKSNILFQNKKTVEPNALSSKNNTNEPNMTNISIRKKKTIQSSISPSNQVNNLFSEKSTLQSIDLTSEQKIDQSDILTSQSLVHYNKIVSEEKINEPNVLFSKKKIEKSNISNVKKKIKIALTPERESPEREIALTPEKQNTVTNISSCSEKNTPNNKSESIKKVKRELKSKVVHSSKNEVKKQNRVKGKMPKKIISKKSASKREKKSSTDYFLPDHMENIFEYSNGEIIKLSGPSSVLAEKLTSPVEACEPSKNLSTKKIKQSKIKRNGNFQHNRKKLENLKQEIKKDSINCVFEAHSDIGNNSPKRTLRNTFESINKDLSCSVEKIKEAIHKTTIDKAYPKLFIGQRECMKRLINASEDFELNGNFQKDSNLFNIPPEIVPSNTFATGEHTQKSIIPETKRTKRTNENSTDKLISKNSTKKRKKSKNLPKNICKPQEQFNKISDLPNMPPECLLPNYFESSGSTKDLPANSIFSRNRLKRTQKSLTHKPLSKHSATKRVHSNAIENISQHFEFNNEVRDLPDMCKISVENTRLKILEPIENMQNAVTAHKEVRRTKKNRPEKTGLKNNSSEQKNVDLKSRSITDFSGNSSNNTCNKLKLSLCSNSFTTDVSNILPTIPVEHVISVQSDMPSDVEVESPTLISSSIGKPITLDDAITEPEMFPVKKSRKYKKRVYKYVAKTLAKRGRPRKQATETVVSDPVRAYMNLLPLNKIALNNFNPFEIEEVNELINSKNLNQCLGACDQNEDFPSY